MSKRTQLMALACLGMGTLAAMPSIQDGSVTLSQDASRKVTIAYTLENEPAIVTVDILTNGVSVGGSCLQTLTGDVNKRVTTGARTIFWQPHLDMPDAVVAAGETRAVVTAWAVGAPPDYMAVSLVATNAVRYYADRFAVLGGDTNDMYKTDWMLFRKIPAAGVKYRMGSPAAENGRTAERETAHIVELTYDFYLAVYELTQQQYINIHDGNKSTSFFSKTDDYPKRPVECTTFNSVRGVAGNGYNWPANGHAVAPGSTLGKLRARVGNGLVIDLPTEAQWEYACRAGTGTAYYFGSSFGNDRTHIRSYLIGGTDGGNSNQTAVQGGTGIVGSLLPNAWGLYDMLGNVSEACLDWFVPDNTACDPEQGPASSSDSKRSRRGGAWNNGYVEVRSAFRSPRDPGGTHYATDGYRFAVHLH